MRIVHIARYGLWLTWQVVVAATAIIADTFRPTQRQQPVLIGMPLRVRTDNEITGLSTSITMTPGTLVAGTRGLDGGGRMFIIHAIFGADLDALYDSLYDMEERMAPHVRDTPRPEAFVFDGYDPAVHADPDETIGTAAETRAGLPGLPASIHPAADPIEENVIPEDSAEHDEGGRATGDDDVVKREQPATTAERKDNRHE